MIYHFSLAQVSIALGILAIITNGLVLWKFQQSKTFLLQLHRNYKLGIILFALAVAWTIWIVFNIDLMEYTRLRGHFIFVVLLIAGCVIKFLPDYLSVRALGILLLLAANILLDATFLRDDPARLIITVLAYVMAIVGMFHVGAPYLARDAIAWLYQNEKRARFRGIFGLVLGILLLALGIFVY